MTLKEILARVMRLAHDLPPDRYGENDLIDMVNVAQEEIAMRSSRFEQQDEVMPAGDSEADLPGDMLRLQEVYWGDEQRMRELFPWVGRVPPSGSVTGIPVRYIVSGDKLILNPVPDMEKTLSIIYTPKPAKLGEVPGGLDEEVGLPGAGDVIVSYVLFRIGVETMDADRVAIWQADYERKLEQWLATYDDVYQKPIKVRNSL